MSSGIALFARTFVIGILVAAPVGAMGVLCIQRARECGLAGASARGRRMLAGVSRVSGALVAIFGVIAIVAGVVG